MSDYTADVNGDDNIDVSDKINASDLIALLRILYNDVMTNWNGCPFNNLLGNYTAQYDFNGDGEINRADLNVIVSYVLDGNTPASGTHPDMDNNGVVNWRDVCIFHVAWMKANGNW